ncbi:UNVERIFIED_CONTAM: efflux RND transporter permease subunit, partial [Bacteroidetes bacterium 56_B9]
YFVVLVSLPPSASIERTEKVVREISDISLKVEGVDHAVQFPGLNINGFTRGSNNAVVFLPLKSFDERGTARKGTVVHDELVQKLAAVKDAFV